MTSDSLRVGIYAAGETTAAVDRSLDGLRAWVAEHSGWKLIEEYFDDLTARSRDDFRRLIADVKAYRLDLVVFRSLAEFVPEGTTATVRHLVDLGRHGTRFASQTERHLSTLGAAGESLARALETLADQERVRYLVYLRERIEESRREGRRGGQKRLPIETRRAIARLRSEGHSLTATARELGVARSTVLKYQRWPVNDPLEILPARAVRKIFGIERRRDD